MIAADRSRIEGDNNAILAGKNVEIKGHDSIAIGVDIKCEKDNSLCLGGNVYVPTRTRSKWLTKQVTL